MILARYEGSQYLVSIRLLQHELLHQIDVNVWTYSCERCVILVKNVYVCIAHALVYPAVLYHLETEC